MKDFKIKPLRFKKFELDNGVKVGYKKVNVPVVIFTINTLQGHIFDPDDKVGLTHFAEHMFFKGAGHYSAEQAKSVLETISGRPISATTFADHTEFSNKCYYKKFDELFRLYYMLYSNLDFKQKDFNDEKKIITSEFLVNTPTGITKVRGDIFNNLFKHTPYTKTPDSNFLKNITLEDIIELKKNKFTGSNTTISIVGGIDENHIIRLLNETFGKLPYGSKNSLPEKIELPKSKRFNVNESFVKYNQLDFLFFFELGKDYFSDYSPVLVMNYLSNGLSSPITSAFRQKNNFCYSAGGASNRNFIRLGSHVISIGGYETAKTKKVYETLQKELNNLKTGKINIKRLNDFYENEDESYFENYLETANSINDIIKDNLLLDYKENFVPFGICKKVTPEFIQKFANEKLNNPLIICYSKKNQAKK